MAINNYSDSSCPFGQFGIGMVYYNDCQKDHISHEKKVVKMVGVTAKTVLANYIDVKKSVIDQMSASMGIDAREVNCKKMSAGGDVFGDRITATGPISAGERLELVDSTTEYMLGENLCAQPVTAVKKVVIRNCTLGKVSSLFGSVSVIESKVFSIKANLPVVLVNSKVSGDVVTDEGVHIWDSKIEGTVECRTNYIKIINSTIGTIIMKLPKYEKQEQRIELVNSYVQGVIFQGHGTVDNIERRSREKRQTPFPGVLINFH